MSKATTAREALVIEVIGEVSDLIDKLEQLQPQVHEVAEEVTRASTNLLASLARFENQIVSLSEKAKVQAVQHILARTDEAAKRSIEQQSRAMVDAARVAFGAEVGAALQRLQAITVTHRRRERWETWLTHAATAVMTAGLTFAMATWHWMR
jgi:uncharacterized protein (DUF342 family)